MPTPTTQTIDGPRESLLPPSTSMSTVHYSNRVLQRPDNVNKSLRFFQSTWHCRWPWSETTQDPTKKLI